MRTARGATSQCTAVVVVVTTMLLALATGPLVAQTPARLREPLPLEVAVSLRSHNGRSPIQLSADGEWVAHTVESADTVPRGVSSSYSDSGFPFAEGDSRMEATLSNTRTDESVRLGGEASSSWAPTWSPDGRRVAFYSDEGGEAGLWIWDRETGTSSRVPGIVARPFFGFEKVRWSVDSRRLLVKVLPAATSLAEANAASARPSRAGRFPEVGPGEASVVVRRSTPVPAPGEETEEEPADVPADVMQWIIDRDAGDLAIVDLDDGSVTRIIDGGPVRAYAWSPDESRVAYALLSGFEPNTQQPSYDLGVYDLATGEHRRLAQRLRLAYGIEWSWSPTGESLAYVASGQLGGGAIVHVNVVTGEARRLGDDNTPSFDPGDGELAPLWSDDGASVFAIGDGSLWRLDVATGSAHQVSAVDGWRMRVLVSSWGSSTLWPTGEDTAWVVAREVDGSSSGIFAVDLGSGAVRPAATEQRSYSGVFNVDASDATGEIVFVASGQQHLPDLWMLDTASDQLHRASQINTALDRYQLGEVRVIDWLSTDGQPLRGALLLPPDFQEGKPVPLVVFVYGGDYGSRSVNRFGFWGEMPAFNMHLLATRGFAVLYPDAPLRVGMAVADLASTVLPGVNAAIEGGFADPERLALMGQSYGSYNTLALMTQTDRFKAAVITAAVLHPDLFTDYLRSMGYYEQGQGNMGGTIWEQHERYLANSPLFVFDRIETPLLIGQGERDGDLVPSEAIFTALERLGKSVEYRLYEGEGHVITQRANVLDFWRRRLEFLAEHLDLDLDDSGAIIPRE